MSSGGAILGLWGLVIAGLGLGLGDSNLLMFAMCVILYAIVFDLEFIERWLKR